MSNIYSEVCIIGMGPRGLSVLERLCANERRSCSFTRLIIHVVDSSAPGAGTVWRTEQSKHLLMNTVACQITIYTDDSVRIDGPIEPGPSLFAWAREIAATDSGDYEEGTVDEARAMTPNTYPTRAFYGQYLHHSFRRIVERAPKHVSVRVHASRAVAIADTHGVPGGPQGARLENGTRLDHLDAIVLAQGHVATALSPREARAASLARIYYLDYIPPSNPADLDLDFIKAGEPVLLRGLGLSFFDHIALLTAGRGGEFVRDGGRCFYEPSGQEPRIYASSRRGVPYKARGENQKGAFGRYQPRLLTTDVINGFREGAGVGKAVRFTRDLWPLISREVESVYYGTMLTARGRDVEREGFVEKYLFATEYDIRSLIAEYGLDDEPWDWAQIADPARNHTFVDRADFREWLLVYLARDVAEAQAGNLSGPSKAALDVLRDLRNEIRLAVDHSGIEGTSHRDDLYGWYTPLNAYLSIGPPASRIEELIALIESGIVEITGPGTTISIDTMEPAFVATSNRVPGDPIRAHALIEARLPTPDVRRTTDPLLLHLLNTGQCAPYRIGAQDNTGYETGGLAITGRPYRLVDADGQAHPRRFAYGVPTEAVHWVTAAGIRPGVDSVTLGDSDAIALAILQLPPVAYVPEGVRLTMDESYATGVIV